MIPMLPRQALMWIPASTCLLQQGKTIAAIQLVREATGWDLQKAKDYVEGLQALE